MSRDPRLDGGDWNGEPEDPRAEIEFHLEMRVGKLLAQGWTEEEARAEARRRFGDPLAVTAAVQREWKKGRWGRMKDRLLNGIWTDVRVAIRQWRRRPGSGMAAAVTLALGIGATTAIFSLVDAILLRPLPFPAPDRMAVIWSDWTERDGPAREWFGYPELHDLRTQVSAFEEVGIWTDPNFTLTERGDAQQVRGMLATEGTLSRVLRVTPHLGRLFGPGDDGPDAPSNVIVSFEFWQTTLGGDPGILGQSLVLDGAPREVVGVLPPRFQAPFGPAQPAQVWMTPRLGPDPGGRGSASWRAVARLVPGATLAQANQELVAFIQRLREIHPRAYVGKTPVVYGMQDELVAPTRRGLQLVMAAVVVVLLLACANVANLLLARNTVRESELAVRNALGAGRNRIVRQLLVESAVLSVVGGAAGIALGWAGMRALVALAPAGTPRLDAVEMDPRVLGFALVVTVLTVLLSGLLPALRTGRRDLRDALVGSGRDAGTDRGGLRLRSGLVVVQVALAVALMAGAGLLGRSFTALRAVDLGFDPADVLTFQISFPGQAYDDPQERAAFQSGLATRFSGLPGVIGVGAVSNLPLGGADHDVSYTIEGRPLPEPGEGKAIWLRQVLPGYMEAMDLRVLAGRGIEATDERGTHPVMVINETVARVDFPGENPIGRRINLGDPADPLWFEIVGIAEDVRNFAVRDDWREAGYISNLQFPGRALVFTLELAEGIDPTSVLPGVRAAVREADGTLAVTAPRTMSDVVANALGPDRYLALLLGGFAILALGLAVIGLYGVVSYTVGARLREVGVRMALGADATDIRDQVLRRSLVPVGIGVGVGLGLAFALGRFARTLLYGVSPADPWSLGSTVAVLLLTAALAAGIPAMRASRVDPMRILREE